mgnify:FL=1
MRIVVHKNDGKGLIDNPVISIAESELTTAEQHLVNIPNELEPMIVEDSDLPDGDYIKAWELKNSSLSINVELSKEVKKRRLRAARAPLLAKLDIDFQRALEDNLDTTDIVAKKRQLRDITEHPDLINAQTFEEVKAFWPEILNS